MQIYGAKVTQGEMENKGKIYPYHNVTMFGLEEIQNGKGVGQSSKTVSMEYKIFCDFMGIHEVTEDVLINLIGKKYTFAFDNYGKKAIYMQELPQKKAV